MEKLCPSCGGEFTGRKDKIFCTEACAQRAGRKRRKSAKVQSANAAGAALVCRILGDSFFLDALDEELASLGRSKSAAKSELEARLRSALVTSPEWPEGIAGRCALILWLLDHPATARIKPRRTRDKIRRPGDPFKPSGTLIRAGIGRVGSRT